MLRLLLHPPAVVVIEYIQIKNVAQISGLLAIATVVYQYSRHDKNMSNSRGFFEIFTIFFCCL